MKKPQIECLESPSMPLSSHNRSGAILATFLAALCAAAAIGDTLDTTPFSKKIPITISGYAGSTELTDFPVLVTLAENAPIGFSYDDRATDGADLRFADATGALLSHEIETWDKTGTSCIWVKVPSIVGTTTKITCYYGADGAATLPTVSATDVWSRYAAVFHGGASIADASGHATEITVNGATTATTGGKAGGVMTKENTKGIAFSNPVRSGALSSIENFSFSGWFRKSCGKTSVIASNKGRGEWNGDGFVALVEGGNYFSVGVGVDGTGAHQGKSGKGALVVDTWGHLAFRYDKSAKTLFSYFDGAEIYSTTSARNIIDQSKTIWAFGGFADNSDNCFQGDMDEVRILNGTASADWIKAEYDSVNTPVSFAVPGNVVAVDHAAPVLGVPVLSRNANGSFSVSVEVSGAAPASIVCTAGGTDFTMTASDTVLPATYSAVVSGLSAGTYTATIAATATSGTVVSMTCPTVFHVGALAVAAVANADEGSLAPGTFRIARADADATGLPALTVSVAFSGAGLDAVSDPGMASVTIPAGEASVDIAITPVYTAAVDADSELVLTVSGDTVGTSSTATMTIVNATFDPAVRYVATSGDDANHGGTPALPKATIAAAVEALATAGQSTVCTVHVAPGTYPVTSPIMVTNAIRVVGCDEDPSRVVVSNASTETGYGKNHRLFWLEDANALLSGMTLENGFVNIADGKGGGGVYAAAGVVSNCVVRNCSISMTSASNAFGGGVFLEGENALLTHCIVSNCSANTKLADWVKVGASGVYVAPGRVENCLVVDCRDPIEKPTNAKMVGGITLNAAGARAVNCTVIGCRGSHTGGILANNASALVRNCVAFGCEKRIEVNDELVVTTVPFGGTATLFDHCASDAAETYDQKGSILGLTSAAFKNYVNGDYTPKAGGPLVNKGANYEGMAAKDLAGNKRLNGSKVDIGCYESQSTALMLIVR
jgi:hypothetical protein